MSSNIFIQFTATLSKESKNTIGRQSTAIRTPGIHLVSITNMNILISNDRSWGRYEIECETDGGETIRDSGFLPQPIPENASEEEKKRLEAKNNANAINFGLFLNIMKLVTKNYDLTMDTMATYLEDSGERTTKKGGVEYVVAFSAGKGKQFYVATYTELSGNDEKNPAETSAVKALQVMDSPNGVFDAKTKLSVSEIQRKKTTPEDFNKKLESTKKRIEVNYKFRNHYNVQQELAIKQQELGIKPKNSSVEMNNASQVNADSQESILDANSNTSPF